MRIAYLECFSGISGDMFLGALIDAGVPARLLEETVAALNVGARLEISRVDRSGIAATKVDVIIGGEKDMPREQYWREREIKKRHEHLTGHTGEHAHEHPHTHDSTQQGAVTIDTREPQVHHTAAHGHGRGLKEIKNIIAAAPISSTAKQRATAIFQALGEAEAKVHNTDIETIHFHEVGSVDAIVDIVGAAVASEALGVDEWVCSPLNVGGGTVQCAHGTFPVPAPATVELLKGAPLYSGEIQMELVTPTGAAIVRTLAARFAPLPAMRIEKIGYGAGSRNFEKHANVVRLTVGEVISKDVASYVSTEDQGAAATDIVRVIEANLDDATPQLLGYVQERLMAAGALDVFCTPIQMKKNRPGTLLSVLARPANEANMVDILFAESTTLGVRIREERRRVLERRTVAVQTPWGEVRVKVAHLGSEVRNAAPEFEDCRRLAAEHHVPLKKVIQAAMSAWAETEHAK
jgi:pyridinium-3,5-bisthiocarboxylic acid mononucleotide nickel chelatase